MNHVVRLDIKGLQVPSFKNRKRVTQRGGLITSPDVKARMERIENAILCALYSESQIVENETPSECWKRLRTVLSGLCDDSVEEIPEGSWATERVAPGEEGVLIEITELCSP